MRITTFIIFIFLNLNIAYSQLSIDTDIQILRAQSDEGNAEAKFFLGALYYSGQGVEQDFSKALKLFEESSNSGYTSATYNLGVIYAKGRGVDIDEDKAIKFYEKAAIGGLDRAQYVYATWLRDGKATEKNESLAMEFFKRSSLQNYGPGLLEVAKGYENGLSGRRDYREAVKLYRQARAHDDGKDNYTYYNATYRLGLLYYKGLGVEKDKRKAIRFIREASDNNVVEAKNYLKNISKN